MSHRNAMVWLFFGIILAIIIGSTLHPIALLLSMLLPNGTSALAVLNIAKQWVTDVVFWAFFFLIMVWGFLVLLSQASHKREIRNGSSAIPKRELTENKVTVVMTAYNDVEAIRFCVPEFKNSPYIEELIVVDNNSKDGTAEVAEALGATVVKETKQGYGFACIRGLREALNRRRDGIIVLVEGDGTYVATDIPKFLAYISDADMVVGTRTVSSLVDRDSQMNIFFVWGNIFLGLMLTSRFWEWQFLGKYRFTDVGCTYRAIRSDALRRIIDDLNEGGDAFSVCMLISALSRGLTVVEIPVRFRKRIGRSKGASSSFTKAIRVGMSMLWKILTYH